MSGALEVHTHHRLHENREWLQRIEHSHADGSVGHEHPKTGCASYIIDKDAWYAATGLTGGGRKKYTVRPNGPQLDLVALTAEQKTFRVVFCDTGHSPEHVRAGVTAEQYEQTRAEFPGPCRRSGWQWRGGGSPHGACRRHHADLRVPGPQGAGSGRERPHQ